MRRRDALAGIASAGTLVGAGAVLVGGVPSFATDDATATDGNGEGGSDDALAIETVDAPGSEAGTARVPGDAPATLVEFFVTGCSYCRAQMPRLAEARARVDDDARFLSVTFQTPETLPPTELADWWERHGGAWPVGYDPTPGLASRYGVVGYPVAIVVDADGEKRFQERGVTPADDLVDAVDAVLDA